MNADVAETRYLVWPERQRPPSVDLPTEYSLRTYRQDDRDALQRLLREHWDLDETQFQTYLDRVLPSGLFLVETRESGDLVGTAGAIHNPKASRHRFPFGSEIAYLYVDENHRRRGLGRAMSAAATRRLIDAGYTSIRAGTTNPAAVLLFLDLAYRPFARSSDAVGLWRTIYDELGLPFDRDRVVTP